MQNLVNHLPDIIEKSGTLFGIFALISIIFAVIVIAFFAKGTSKEKFQALGLVFLFFLGVGISALMAGIFAGTERGSEIAVQQIEQDSSIACRCSLSRSSCRHSWLLTIHPHEYQSG